LPQREPFLHHLCRFRSAVPFVFKGFVETGNRQRYTPRRFAGGGIVTVVTVTCDRLKGQERPEILGCNRVTVTFTLTGGQDRRWRMEDGGWDGGSRPEIGWYF